MNEQPSSSPPAHPTSPAVAPCTPTTRSFSSTAAAPSPSRTSTPMTTERWFAAAATALVMVARATSSSTISLPRTVAFCAASTPTMETPARLRTLARMMASLAIGTRATPVELSRPRSGLVQMALTARSLGLRLAASKRDGLKRDENVRRLTQ